MNDKLLLDQSSFTDAMYEQPLEEVLHQLNSDPQDIGVRCSCLGPKDIAEIKRWEDSSNRLNFSSIREFQRSMKVKFGIAPSKTAEGLPGIAYQIAVPRFSIGVWLDSRLASIAIGRRYTETPWELTVDIVHSNPRLPNHKRVIFPLLAACERLASVAEVSEVSVTSHTGFSRDYDFEEHYNMYDYKRGSSNIHTTFSYVTKKLT